MHGPPDHGLLIAWKRWSHIAAFVVHIHIAWSSTYAVAASGGQTVHVGDPNAPLKRPLVAVPGPAGCWANRGGCCVCGLSGAATDLAAKQTLLVQPFLSKSMRLVGVVCDSCLCPCAQTV